MAHPERAADADRLGGFIYGTIVAMAVIVDGSHAYPHDSGRVAALVAGTAVVFWLAHVYAHGLGRSLAHDEHLTLAVWSRIARGELSLVEAGVLPIAALLLGAFGVVAPGTAYWLALGAGIAVLLIQGVRFARKERLGRLATLGVVAANVCLGLLLVGLKLVAIH